MRFGIGEKALLLLYRSSIHAASLLCKMRECAFHFPQRAYCQQLSH